MSQNQEQLSRVLGTRKPRIDGYERVSGTATYTADVILPRMLYAAILRCPHAHAKVLRVDATAARKMPGVAAVIDARTPGADLEWRYWGFPSRIFDPVCRHEGEAVAAVAARTLELARDALRRIKVEYEVLPFVADETEALAEQAAKVHDSGNQVGETQHYERGDVTEGFAQAAVVLEQTYRTECEIHNPLEPHCCVANWDGERLTLWESTQGVFAVQSTVAATLGLPLSNVRVIGTYMGGGFGAKLEPGKYTIIASLLARAAARPVKLVLSREECQLAVGNRPPAQMWLKAGATRDGTLTALDMRYLGTSGAYPSGGTSLIDWEVKDLYRCANVRTEGTDVFINAGPVRPFRAPGHPQGSWALEQMMDALAQALDMDPVTLRLRNLTSCSQAREGCPPYTTTGLEQCLMQGAQAFGWETRDRPKSDGHLRRGVGVAAAHWIVGGGEPPATVIVKMLADGSVNLNLGASDIGTGTRTVMAMVVAEVLGVELDRISVENADTGTTQFATPSGGSKTVPTESPAVYAAASELKERLLELAAEELGVDEGVLEMRDGMVARTDDPSTTVGVTELAGLRRQGVVVGIGYRGPNPEGKVVNPFAAQFCEVEVNTLTGEVTVLRFVAAHDSGRVLNRLTFANQVNGGVNMGLGLAMTEERVLDRAQTGKTLTRSLLDYKLPSAMEVPPEVVTVPVDMHDREANTVGAKGLGEPATIPAAAAIANAVCNATGVRVTSSPITPGRLRQLIAAERKEV